MTFAPFTVHVPRLCYICSFILPSVLYIALIPFNLLLAVYVTFINPGFPQEEHGQPMLLILAFGPRQMY